MSSAMRELVRQPLVTTGLLASTFLVSLMNSGCVGGLDQPTLVKTPRILNIIARTPESMPGEDIEVGVIAYAPEDPTGASLTYRWRMCDSLPRVLRAAQIPLDTTMLGSSECFVLSDQTGPTATLPGARTMRLADTIRAIAAADPRAGFLGAVLDTAGIPFEVEVDVLSASGDVLVTGKKIIAIGTRTMPPLTTNPPAVPFSIDDQDIAMAPDLFNHACIPLGGPIRIQAGAEVEVAPIAGAEWTESFPIYDFSGRIRLGTENEYYSFYATDGSISEETSRPPNRAIQFRAPNAPGSLRFWMIVRDGHLGGRGCFIDIEVTAR